MADLLVPILRGCGLNAKDGDDITVLEDLLMRKNEDMHDKVMREYMKRLFNRHGINDAYVPDEYRGYKSPPLLLLSIQARLRKRPWRDMELVLNNLPPRMAKDALMRADSKIKRIPLHIAAGDAPCSVVDRMLALAPDSIRVKNSLGSLPLHYAGPENENIDVVESLVNAYPYAIIEVNNNGDSPIDRAIYENSMDVLRVMFSAAIKLSCTNNYLDYGKLLDDKAQYNESINPINLVLIEAIQNKRSADDVVEFINQLDRKPILFRALMYHTTKTNTESSPGSFVRRINFNDNDSRARVLHSLKNAGDDKERMVSHNTSSGLDDSPRGPDRLGRRPLAKAIVEVLKTIETPYISIASSIFGGWGSGKSKVALMLVEEMIRGNPSPQEDTMWRPSIPFIWICNHVEKYCYFFGQTDGSSEDGVEEINVIHGLPAITFFDFVCTCVNSIFLPLSYVFNCFKLGTFDVENGVDIQQLDENGRVIIIGLVVIIFFPLVLLAMTCYYATKLYVQKEESTIYVVSQDCGEYKCAAFVLETLFKSHPSNRLPPIVDILAKTFLFFPRQLYSVYECFAPDYYGPYSRISDETTYIDVAFNVWEYSGSDVLWASLILKLYNAVESKYSKEEIDVYKLACNKLGEVDPDVKSDRFKKVLKQLSTNRTVLNVLFFISLPVIVAALVVWSYYSFNLKSPAIAITELFVIFTFFLAFVKSANDLYQIQKENLRASFEAIRSTANIRNDSDQSAKRSNYEAVTGFMGDIKGDTDCLLGFLRARNGRLIIVIDDLDRCNEDDIVEILQAVILLLNDCPITCFLAIDSRIVISVLDMHMDKFCPQGNVSGREYLDKIIQLPVYIGDIDENVKQEYIEFSSEGKSLTEEKLLGRIYFFKEKKLLGDDFPGWEEVESVYNPLDKIVSAVTFLRDKERLTLSRSIPSVHDLKKDKEKLDKFLLSVSRALNSILQENTQSQPEELQNINRIPSAPSTPYSNTSFGMISTSNTNMIEKKSTVDMSRYKLLYSPLLNVDEFRWVNELLFVIPGNPRSIKRILNIYSLARAYRSHKYGFNASGVLSKKMLKFIILLERWPYATSLMLAVVTRVNYERYDRNVDKETLHNRILHQCHGVDDFKLLKLHRLYEAVEQIVLGRSARIFKDMLSKDHDNRLFKNCLLHGDEGEILMVKDIDDLRPYAFNMNSMFFDRAAGIIEQNMS